MERPGAIWRGARIVLGATAWAIAPAVATAAWSAPQDLAPTSELVALQPLAIDAGGTALALLVSGDLLQYAEQGATAQWAAPRSLGESGAARMVVTPRETLVVWPRSIGPDSHIVTASRTLEGVWSGPTEIGSVSGSQYLRAVSLSADTLGSAVTGLIETNNPANPSAVLARTPEGAWSPLDLGPVPPWARVIVDDSGAMTAVWREDSSDENSGRGRLRLAERAAGGAFVEVPSPFGERPLALLGFSGTSAGDAMVVANAETGTTNVWLRPAGGAFGPPREIRSQFTGFDDSSMGADGTAALVWRAGDGIRALVRAPGGDFGAPVTIPAAAPDGLVSGPRVSVGRDGTIVVAWSSMRSTGRKRVAGTVWASVRRPGGAFGRAVVVNDRRLPASLGRVAAGEDGVAVITWAESTGAGFVVQAARNEPRPLITRLTATSPTGGEGVRLRLAEPANVTVVLTRAAGRVLARRTRSLPAGASTVTVAAPGTLTAGRYRIRISARSANRSAGANVHVRATATP